MRGSCRSNARPTGEHDEQRPLNSSAARSSSPHEPSSAAELTRWLAVPKMALTEAPEISESTVTEQMDEKQALLARAANVLREIWPERFDEIDRKAPELRLAQRAAWLGLEAKPPPPLEPAEAMLVREALGAFDLTLKGLLKSTGRREKRHSTAEFLVGLATAGLGLVGIALGAAADKGGAVAIVGALTTLAGAYGLVAKHATRVPGGLTPAEAHHAASAVEASLSVVKSRFDMWASGQFPSGEAKDMMDHVFSLLGEVNKLMNMFGREQVRLHFPSASLPAKGQP